MARNETVLLGLNQLTDWGILTTDADLIVTRWNRWLEERSGLAAECVVERNLLELFPELVSRRLERFYRQALAGQVVVLSQRLHKYLLPLPPPVEDSNLSHMQQCVRIVPLVEEGRVVGTLTAIEDVTERVVFDAELGARARQQAALAALGQRALAGKELPALVSDITAVVAETLGVEFSAFFELLPEGEALVLRAGIGWKKGEPGSATVEAGTNSHAGYTLHAGQPLLFENLPAETRFQPALLLTEHGIVSGLSVPVVSGEGRLGVVGVYAGKRRTFTEESVLFLQAAANVLGLAVERSRLEDELRSRAEQLVTADRRKDEFLAMLAHELRNPLAPIRNAAQLLSLKYLPEPELQFAAEVIERQVQQMTRMIDDLLDVSRITRGKVDLQKEPVDLAAAVARALEISRPLINARKQQLTVTLPPDALPLDADLARLAQVVANLLNNAAKFTEEGGRIALTVERSGSEAVLQVRDTGVGIAPEMLSSIFDLFAQVQGSVSRSEGGLGIGLSLVRSLVEMHGGSVRASSEGIGRGSEFTVRLPLLKTALAAGTPGDGEALRSRKIPPRRILLVDDNMDAARSLAMLLRFMGHEVSTAHDGLMALEAARERRPEVVLLDIGLPRIDGLEVARRIRQELGLKDALLIALTGYGQEEDRRRSLAAGFDAHLVKPVDLDGLKALLIQPDRAG